MRNRIANLLLGSLTATLASCAGEGPAPNTSTEWFAVLQRDIFDQSCTSGPCHNPQAVAGGLILTAAFSYQQLVDAAPQNPAALGDGLLRVSPFDPDGSFLLRKLEAPGPGEGSRMPQGAAPLSSAEIQFIRDWILEGAPGPGTPSATNPTATPTATEVPGTATIAAPSATPSATSAAATPTPGSDTATPGADTPTPGADTATPAAETPTPTEPVPTQTAQPTTPIEVTIEQVQEEVFSPSCAIQFCHSGAFPAAGLSLEEGESFAELVNVPPTNPAAINAGYLLVEPGNPDESFLYVKIVGPPSIDFGARMPMLGGVLDSEQIALVRDWILSLD